MAFSRRRGEESGGTGTRTMADEAVNGKRSSLDILLDEWSWKGALGDTLAVRNRLDLRFADVKTVSGAFKPFVRELAYDCGELAVVTLMQAICYGRPLVLLPFVVTGRPSHRSIAYPRVLGTLTPEGLAGRRVGVRTYSQTSGVWVRGILQHDHGVDLDKITWVTFEDAHLPEHVDPPNCTRSTSGKPLAAQLLDADLDAAILGGNMPKDPRLRPLIPNVEAEATAFIDTHGVMPINHMFVVTKALCAARPDLVRALYAGLVEVGTGDAHPFPHGLDGDWKALEMVGAYAFEQGVIPRRLSVDELFADAARILDA